MTALITNQAFLIYSATALILCVNLLALWGYSGAVRGRSMTTPNSEDSSTVSKGSKLVDADPPEVARVLRAHSNAAANIVPFLILAFLYLLWGASTKAMAIFCGLFVVFRLGHTLAYLGGKQPWRTILFVGGGLTTIVLMGMLGYAMAHPIA